MKTTAITLLFLMTMFCTSNANTNAPQQCWRSHITLNGYYDESEDSHAQTRSLPAIPIQASLDGTDLYFSFSSSISDLSIAIMKDGMEIESKTVTVEDGQSEVIDLAECESGSYQLVLTTEQGTCLSGEFNL